MNLPTHRHLARYRFHEVVTYGLVEPDGLKRLSAAPWDGGEPTGVIDDAPIDLFRHAEVKGAGEVQSL